MKLRRVFGGLFLAGLVVAGHRAGGQEPGKKPACACAPLGIVFMVNGSNADLTGSESLCDIVRMQHLPLAIETIQWCRYGQMLKDHRDRAGQLDAGHRLADKILAYRQKCPGGKIYLIGHSAGTHVVLLAAALCPPRSVDRIMLLGSSVSRYHDLRPILHCSRGGIDCFYSPEDNILSLVSGQVGPADDLPAPCAGETGFARPSAGVADANLYQNLRQYRWNPGWTALGHHGGHSGYLRLRFMEGCVLPFMLGTISP